MTRHSAILLLALPCVLMACGDDTSDGGTADAGPPEMVVGPPGAPGEKGEPGEPAPLPPEPVACSETELCLEDGLAAAAVQLQGVVDAFCEQVDACCNADEIRYKFGPGVASVDDCKDKYGALLARGHDPQLTSIPGYSNGSGSVGTMIARWAHAINTERGELNPDAVDDCVTALEGLSCNEVPTPVCADPVDNCQVVDDSSGSDLCNFGIIGLQGLEQPCMSDDECAEGFLCEKYPGGSNYDGICIAEAVVDDSCVASGDCRVAYGNDPLFCNQKTAMCQAYGAAGDPCEYADPTLYTSTALVAQCEGGLQCDPISKTCVDQCEAGRFCSDNRQCASGQVCLRTGNWFTYDSYLVFDPDNCSFTYDSFVDGVCGTPIAADAECTYSAECATGNCGYDATDMRSECQAALAAVGAACTVNGDCVSGICDNVSGGSNTCLKNGNDCDTGPGGTEYYYYRGGDFATTFACYPLEANDAACDNNGQCTSGFCDYITAGVHTATDLCKAPAAAAATCGQQVGCTSGTHCDLVAIGSPTETCLANLAVGAECVADEDCGVGHFCVDHDFDQGASTLFTCQKQGTAPGDACHPSVGNFNCDGSVQSENFNDLACNGTDFKCYFDNEWPDGATGCSFGDCLNDCRDVSGTNTCVAHGAAGDDCTAGSSGFMDPPQCGEGLFCNVPDHDTDAGTCAAQLATGVICDPIDSNSCMYGSCVLSHGIFVCNPPSSSYDAIICDGN